MIYGILRYGTLAGVIVGGLLSTIVLALPQAPHGILGMATGYLIMLVGLSLVFMAIKHQRDEVLGGVIRFWPAFGMGLAVSFIASVIYAIAWDLALAITHQDFAGAYARTMIASEEAKGVSGARLAAFKAEMDEFRRNYANPLFRLPMTFVEIFPVGVLVSLVSAALLRNSRFLPAARA